MEKEERNKRRLSKKKLAEAREQFIAGLNSGEEAGLRGTVRAGIRRLS